MLTFLVSGLALLLALLGGAVLAHPSRPGTDGGLPGLHADQDDYRAQVP
jgi:hypothetical protein